MPSPVDICNRALSRLGDSRITSLGDNTKAARAANASWEMVRDEVYREHPWNSITRRIALQAETAAPLWGFSNEFLLTDDILRVLDVEDIAVWVVEGRSILVDDAGPINIQYCYQQTDTNLLEPLLISALAARMKVELAEELTSSNTKVKTAWEEYDLILKRAKRVNAQEGVPTPADEDLWITARI